MCAGIKVVHAINQSIFDRVTHHLTKTLSPTALQVVTLVHNAHLVTPAWLQRIIYLYKLPHLSLTQRAGLAGDADQNLTDSFALPSESAYVPPPERRGVHPVDGERARQRDDGQHQVRGARVEPLRDPGHAGPLSCRGS